MKGYGTVRYYVCLCNINVRPTNTGISQACNAEVNDLLTNN
jgi:hypothetical protein